MSLILSVVAAGQLGQALRKEDTSQKQTRNGACKDASGSGAGGSRKPILDSVSPHYSAQFRCSQLQGAAPHTAQPHTLLPHPHFWR